jgi:hypothetical protein
MTNIYPQLAKFQQSVGTITKDSTGHNYKYASFDKIVETITPFLKECNLGFTHTFDTSVDGIDIICTLFSTKEDVEPIVSRATLPKEMMRGMNASQSVGASITYFRRYTLSAILGLVTDEDTDGVASTPSVKQNSSQGQNSSDDKPWLNVKSEQFAKVLEQVSKYSPDDLVKLARMKYKVSKDTEKAIRDSYRDNYEEVQLED